MKAVDHTGGPAFPLLQDGFQFPRAEGMTLLDYFMAHIGDENQGDEGMDYTDSVKAMVVGRPCPSGSVDGWLAVMQFEADFRAAWRLMRAQAMVKARGAA
jgi:hypothetical protein